MNRKVYLILSIMFMILCFSGAIYVLVNNGEVSPGYAIIPMLFGIIFQMLYRNGDNKSEITVSNEVIAKPSFNIVEVEKIKLQELQKSNQLVEIKDNFLINQIKNEAPNTFKNMNTINNAKKIKDTYTPNLSAGEKLSKSLKNKDKFTSLVHDKKGNLKKNVSWTKNEVKTIDKAKNITASAMNIGALVVGQHYMSEINQQLTKISDDISKISDFQNDEYLGKILSKMTIINSIANFKTEILANDEERKQSY